MNYILTQHARDVLQEREIALEWLERVLLTPERIEPDRADGSLEHRLGRIPEFGNRVLRVVVATAEPFRIVTVYFDRTMKGMP